MYIKIQTSEKSNGNKGGSTALANYLEKEDLELEKESLEKGKLPEPRKGFFNQHKDKILKDEVIETIDNNKKKLGKNDAKFYSIIISPSEKEQKHIIESITSKDINSIEDLKKEELNKYELQLKEYTIKAMDEYAKNFKREGLKDGSQLVYFGKIEHIRKHKGKDNEVLNGNKKSGEKKEGLNTHIHLIVSRKDNEQKYKLSPLAKEKGHSNKSKLNGKVVQRGFDRNLFRIKSEKVFDNKFKYKRELDDKIEYKIQSSRETELKFLENLSKTKEEKQGLQLDIINRYNERNGYNQTIKQQQNGIKL